MKAAILAGKGSVVIKDIPRPKPGKGEVLVKVMVCAICGSDVHSFESLMFPIGTILGHEFSGIIEEVGPEVTRVKKGDRVVVRPPGICGCDYCNRGQFALCDNHFDNTVGLKIPGGYAEYVVVDAYKAIPLDDTISFEQAAQIEPLSVCVRGVTAGAPKLGDRIVIIGGGPIGLLVLQLLKHTGASRIYMVEVAEKRRRMAAELGADCVINPVVEDPIASILAVEKGGVDMVFECVGREVTINTGLEICKKGGKILMLGATLEQVKLNQLKMLQRAITLQASMGYYVDDFNVALRLVVKDMVNLDVLVSHVIGLDEVESALKMLHNPEQALKVLIKPNAKEMGN